MSHVYESCHIWISHATRERVMSHIYKSCHIWTSHVTYERVVSHMNVLCHIWTSHVTYEQVKSHICPRHIAHERVMPHMTESCHTWTSHVTYDQVVSHKLPKTQWIVGITVPSTEPAPVTPGLVRGQTRARHHTHDYPRHSWATRNTRVPPPTIIWEQT